MSKKGEEARRNKDREGGEREREREERMERKERRGGRRKEGGGRRKTGDVPRFKADFSSLTANEVPPIVTETSVRSTDGL
jgi:hypothetical protein